MEGTGIADPGLRQGRSPTRTTSRWWTSPAAPVTPADRWTFTPATAADRRAAVGAEPSQLNAASWLTVGYGTEEAQRGGGPQTHPGGGTRLKATLGFNALNPSWIRLSMIESQGYGGACYGDSGGPNFVTIGRHHAAGRRHGHR